VRTFLEKWRLLEYADLLKGEGFEELDVLLEIKTKEDLEKIGIRKPGHIKRMLIGLKEERESSTKNKKSLSRSAPSKLKEIRPRSASAGTGLNKSKGSWRQKLRFQRKRVQLADFSGEPNCKSLPDMQAPPTCSSAPHLGYVEEHEPIEMNNVEVKDDSAQDANITHNQRPNLGPPPSPLLRDNQKKRAASVNYDFLQEVSRTK